MKEISGAIAFSLLWPAAAAVSLGVAVGKAEVTAYGIAMLACGTMAAYGLDRLIDSRGTDSRHVRRALQITVGFAAIMTAAIACTAIWRMEVCAVLTVLAAGYVPLKRIVPKNFLVVPAWTIAIGSLPFASAPSFDGHFAAALSSVMLIMSANTMICDVGSVEADRHAKVRALSVWLGGKGTLIAAGIFASIGAAVAVSHSHYGLAVTAASLIIVAATLWNHPKSWTGHCAADLALTLFPGPLTHVIG